MSAPSRATKWSIAALLAGFALLCALRLNGLSLLEPDSPEYLFGARSLATLHGYREIDRPGEPLNTLRPPGLSLILAPLSWSVPYSVVGAKLVVAAFALIALLLTMRLAARDGPTQGALVAGLLVATSPYAVLHATEVVTEFPYIACALAAIGVMTRSQEPPPRRDVALAALLLAFLPFLRTIGLALVLATLAWCLLYRTRRSLWPAPVLAVAPTALWMLRCNLARGPTYPGSIAAEWSRLGPSAFAAKAVDNAGFYAARFTDVLLPGLRPARPLYERMTVGGTPDLGGLYGAAVLLGLAIVAAAIVGGWLRRRTDGALLGLYGVAYVLVLAVYPPRHERLVWPLVPIVWALASAAIARAGRAVRIAALVVAGSLVSWQLYGGITMARDNLAYSRNGQRFYEERVPPIYFCDWRAAGAWLREHAAPHARILTRHSDVGFTSGRPQESIRFEELPPQVWRGRIARLHARYLVVPTVLFGKYFPFELLSQDPIYEYAVKRSGRGVAVIEIGPNRTGRVAASPQRSPESGDCERALAREPTRVDLETRCAELSAAAGRRDEAIAGLAAVVASGGADVRVEIALGQLLLNAGRRDEAAAAFDRASRLPEADLLAQTIERGRSSASGPKAPGSFSKLAEARSDMELLVWDAAKTDLDEALAADPGNAEALKAAAVLALRFGEYDRARSFFATAGAHGDARAASEGAALADALDIETTLTSAPAASIVRAAAFWAGEGAPGRALDLLERAAARLPGDAEIALHVAELRRFYGLD